MKTKLLLFCIICSIASTFCSCEKPVFEENTKEEEKTSDKFNLTFDIAQFEQIPFADAIAYSRSKDIKQVCTRLNFAVFNDDTKVAAVNQTSSDKNFGKISVSLPAGTYRFLVLAHNCTGNATITNLSKIKFPDNKITDTFYYCEEINVDAAASYQLELRRCVAQFKLIVEDAIPDEVKKMKFFYTGGSSTFDAINGNGSVASRQTEERNVKEEQRSGNAEFGVYTFPRDGKGELKVTVTALNASDVLVKEQLFEHVPITKNRISLCKENFFGTPVNTNNNTFSFVVNDEWEQQEYTH